MIKYLSSDRPDPKMIYEGLKDAYGIPHPEKVLGFGGFFFTLGDVYVSDRVYEAMRRDDKFEAFVRESLDRFKAEDYGLISGSDRDENVENRYFGGGAWMFARYFYENKPFSRFSEYIKVRTMVDYTYVAFDSEFDPPECDPPHDDTLKRK